MIADLIGAMNNLQKSSKVATNRSVLFPAPALISTSYWRTVLIGNSKTYVYHESTRATRSVSISLTYRSQRTKPQFLCVVPSERSCDLLMGQEGRASVERRGVAGRLQKYSWSLQYNFRNGERTIHLVHFVYHFVKSDYERKLPQEYTSFA
jgi:hypothetical protein